MAAIREETARELALRLAGAAQSRRIYGAGQSWERTLAALEHDVHAALAPPAPDRAPPAELSFAILGEVLAVGGVPIVPAPQAVLRFVEQLRRRDVEIISLTPGVSAAELEVLLSFLAADAAELAAFRGDTWLRERGVEHVRIKHLRLAASGLESFRDLYRRGGELMARELGKAGAAGAAGALDLGAIAELARSLMALVYDSETPVGLLLALRDRADHAMVHALNVGVLVGHQAAALGLDEALVESYGLAGLLHDVGKARLPEGLLGKPAHALTKEERARIDRHAAEGARMLLDASRASPLAALVAAAHHGGSLPGEAQLAVELTRIADAFDGVSTLRPYDGPGGPRGVVAWLAERMSPGLNPYLLDRFAALLGVVAPGERGSLATGELVQVVELHEELGLRPVVEVLERRGGWADRGMRIDLARMQDVLHLELPQALATLDPDALSALG